MAAKTKFPRAISGTIGAVCVAAFAPPLAARVGNSKAVFNLRGDNSASTGGLTLDTNLGWKGGEKYVATGPRLIDLWADPQERYDIFMNDDTERTWTLVTINNSIQNLMKSYLKYPARKLQSGTYTEPITLSRYQRLKFVSDVLPKEGFHLPLPTGN